MLWRNQLRAPWEAVRREGLLFYKTGLVCIIHQELSESVWWVAKTVAKSLKKAIHGTSVLCVFHFTDFLRVQTHAMSTKWSCLPPVAKYALHGDFSNFAIVGALDMEGTPLHSERPRENTCRTTVSVGWRRLGKGLVFSLETKWNHFGSSSPFQTLSDKVTYSSENGN